MILRQYLTLLLCGGATCVQAQKFETDIAPLLQRECIDCHGSDLQMGGLRLDRREDALQVIEPGKSEDSLLIQRLVDADMRVLMPPKFGDGSGLSDKDIKTLRSWIQSGADWPYGAELAKQDEATAETVRAAELRRLVRDGEFRKVEELIKAEPELLDIRNEEGSTVLHAACLYGDQALVRTLIGCGAPVNVSDRDGVTPLMLAVHDAEKVWLLLKAGADKFAASKRDTTPLEIAATYSGNVDVVKQLLHPPLQASGQKLALDHALENATLVLDVKMVRELIAKGGRVKNPIVFFLARSGSTDFVRLLLEAVASEQRQLMLDAALSAAAYEHSAATMRMLLDQGANPTPALAIAAYSEYVRPANVQLLLDAGAAPHQSTRIMRNNASPLEAAQRRGHPEVVELIIKANAE